MVATLYDQSLDTFAPQSWLQRFGFFRQDSSTASPQFENSLKSFQHMKGYWERPMVDVEIRYRRFPDDLVGNYQGFVFARARNGGRTNAGLAFDAAPAPVMAAMAEGRGIMDGAQRKAVAEDKQAGSGAPPPAHSCDSAPAR